MIEIIIFVTKLIISQKYSQIETVSILAKVSLFQVRLIK